MYNNQHLIALFEPYTNDVLQTILNKNEEERNHYELLQKGTCSDPLKLLYKSRIEVRQDMINKLTLEIERRNKIID